MAAPPWPAGCANTRDAAATAVAAAPVLNMLRRIGSIIGASLIIVTAAACGSPRCGPGPGRRPVFRYDRWCANLVAQVLLTLKGPLPASGTARHGLPLQATAVEHSHAGRPAN